MDKNRINAIGFITCFTLLLNSIPFQLFIENEILLFIINVIMRVISIVVLLLYIKKENLNHLKFGKLKLSHLSLLPLLIISASNIIVSLFQGINIKNNINYFNLITGIILSIGVGILEELLFRGQILDEFLKHQSKFKSIIYSSLIFGSVHLLNISSLSSIIPVLSQVAYSFVLGLILAYVYLKTDNIIIPIVFHSLFNILNSIVISSVFILKLDFVYYIVNIFVGIITLVYLIIHNRLSKTNN